MSERGFRASHGVVARFNVPPVVGLYWVIQRHQPGPFRGSTGLSAAPELGVVHRGFNGVVV
jgi:hypothetical protein